jgi:multimeric flavodoxin WrbA
MKDSKPKEKILALLGSPRKKGNSASLSEKIIEGAESVGWKSEKIFLHDLNISPCRACYACQKSADKGCAVDDDMQLLYPKLIEAEAWIIASPVYWFTMSAQTKLFMDRCFALLVYDEKSGAYDKVNFRGKRIAIAMSYNDPDPFKSGCVNALHTFQDAFRYAQAHIVGMVYGQATEAGEIKAKTDLMKEALELGKKLASPGLMFK